MENNQADIILTLISSLGFLYVFLRLLVTVIPLQIREAQVKNGLAKLRRHLLLSGVSIMHVSLIGFIILILSIIHPNNGLLMEFLVLLLVCLLVIVAETKYAIYHEQYTEEHKELSRKIQAEIDKEESLHGR